MTATILFDIEGIEQTKRIIKMIVTLNQILQIENVLSTRSIPSIVVIAIVPTIKVKSILVSLYMS